MRKQRTLKREVNLSGIGVHTGNMTSLTFKPAPPDHGIKFRVRDGDKDALIEARIDNVIGVQRGTTLGTDGVRIQTVEHVMATLMGFGIDNLLIEVSSRETPVGDGSAMPFVEMVQDAGIEEQDALKHYFRLREPIYLSENGVCLIALPSDKLKISCTISYGRPGLDSQYVQIEINEDTFVNEIAPSRTFCFYNEVEHLMEAGLIKGGSLDNAVVIKDEAILSKEGLRFPNEFVRHKLLDLMGDIYLLGAPLLAHIIAIKSGHLNNIELTKLFRKKMMKAEANTQTLESGIPELDALLDINKIMETLPHRYPFLLVDKIVALEDNRKIVGIKNVTINEPFFQGHFPGHPVMPGVLLIEAMAQVGAILLLTQSSNQGKLAYFMTVDKCKFRKPVMPGDILRIEAQALTIKTRTARLKGHCFVGDTVVCEAELMCSLVDK